jgi:hypothetical protein
MAAVVGTGTILGGEGPVTCLAVSGNIAIIGFSSPVPGLARTLIRVTDGGGSSGQDSFEFVAQAGGFVPPPDCSFFPPTTAGDFVLTGAGVNDFGDIVVVDAPALPISKEQCKKGGWQSFGVFKNQGIA